MVDNEKEEYSPNISNNHTNNIQKSRRKSIITIILILIILALLAIATMKLFFKKDKFYLSQEVFLLSDNSTLLFIDEENYILSYDILDQTIDMKGKYRLTYNKSLDPNIEYEYSTYIQEFKEKNYTLGFLELQNQELYINDVKSSNGYVNTYYILMMYYDENNNLVLSGYNVDTGIRVGFKEQKGKFYEYYTDKNT